MQPQDRARACPVCGRSTDDGHACAAPETLHTRDATRDGRPAARRAAPEFVGKLLGEKYRVIDPIGAGAMGMVYVVEHVRLQKRFAAKLLGPDLARHPDAVARFETEAQAASRLDHENIVSVLDYGVSDEGFPFIIMELLRGETLQARMDRGAFSVDEAVGIVIQVCQALAAAHTAGIVHRDVKPDNIFLARRPGGRALVKMLDFGIAKASDHSAGDGRITKQGQLLGSPEYMSPEAARGDEVDARADTYAVGILLYELLCGVVPFRHRDAHHLLQMQAVQAPAPPRELAPHLPQAVERLILRALEKEPQRRQPSIKKLQLELMAALPEVAQRVLRDPPPGPRATWQEIAPRRAIDLDGVVAGLAEGTVAVEVPAAERATTLDVRRRGARDPLVALWTGAAILTATAAILLVMKRSAAPLRRPDGAGSAAQVDPAARARAGAAPAAEAGPDQIRLRISTSPPGARATLQGQPIGRTPIDTWVRAVAADGELELDLRGYEATERTVPLDRDSDIRVSLDREPRRSRASERRRRERARERAERRAEGREKKRKEKREEEREEKRDEKASAEDDDLKAGR